MDLAPEVRPVAWLAGHWRGTGTIGYPDLTPAEISNEIIIGNDGGPYLNYQATVRIGAEVWATESGFFRIPPRVAFELPAGAHPVELLVSDPAGYVTVYVGLVRGHRIDLASDVVARVESGAPVAAGRRQYGLVESDLLLAWDLAAFGHPLQSYLAARLTKADA